MQLIKEKQTITSSCDSILVRKRIVASYVGIPVKTALQNENYNLEQEMYKKKQNMPSDKLVTE